MTAHVPMARVPFATLDNPRLQHLASAKNSQSGMIAQAAQSNGKSSVSLFKSVSTATKRPLEPASFDDFDSENIDPALLMSPSKKSKSGVTEKPFKPFTFTPLLSTTMPPPPVPSRLSTPAKPSMSSPRAPLTAPAGRSPKRKASSILKGRRTSAPFSRIDPPFSSRDTSGLPFSLDAALKGTFSHSAPKSAGATIKESMPKNWFFDIYEDTPDEVASNLMEHSTLTLDISSDEESSKKEKDDRGKENMPPEDYDAPTASRPAAEPTVAAPKQIKKHDIIRRKVATEAMDDGERSPLSDLETEPFISEGLSKDSHVVVDPISEHASTSLKMDMSNLFAAPINFTAGSSKKSNTSTPSKSVYDMPVVNGQGDVKGDIIVWEDSPTSAKSSSPSPEARLDEKRDLDVLKGAIKDENTQPEVEEEL